MINLIGFFWLVLALVFMCIDLIKSKKCSSYMSHASLFTAIIAFFNLLSFDTLSKLFNSKSADKNDKSFIDTIAKDDILKGVFSFVLQILVFIVLSVLIYFIVRLFRRIRKNKAVRKTKKTNFKKVLVLDRDVSYDKPYRAVLNNGSDVDWQVVPISTNITFKKGDVIKIIDCRGVSYGAKKLKHKSRKNHRKEEKIEKLALKQKLSAEKKQLKQAEKLEKKANKEKLKQEKKLAKETKKAQAKEAKKGEIVNEKPAVETETLSNTTTPIDVVPAQLTEDALEENPVEESTPSPVAEEVPAEEEGNVAESETAPENVQPEETVEAEEKAEEETPAEEVEEAPVEESIPEQKEDTEVSPEKPTDNKNEELLRAQDELKARIEELKKANEKLAQDNEQAKKDNEDLSSKLEKKDDNEKKLKKAMKALKLIREKDPNAFEKTFKRSNPETNDNE